jgi:hypothetical protein
MKNNYKQIIFILLLLLLLFCIYNSIIKSNYIQESFDDDNEHIVVFYHIYCNEHTFDVLKDQINKIIWSGLYQRCSNIYCFLAGQEKYIHICKDYIKECGNKFTIEDIGINDTSYERFTLLKIKNYLQPNTKFLYLHTKGITQINNSNVENWRYLMEYFLIGKWRDCIQELKNHDIVGINKYNPENGWPIEHYSGNFWWATSDYFNKLPDEIGKEYNDPEYYIFLKDPKSKTLFSSGLEGHGHYLHPFPLNKYLDKD